MWAIVGSILCAQPTVVDSPPEITPAWEAKVFGIRYGVTDLAHAVEEMTVGITEPYFGKELLDKLQGQTTGEYVEYWENGKMKVRLPHKDGKANGHLHGWYVDGKDAFKGYFKEGVKQGIHITFFPPGTHRYPSEARILTYNEYGYLEGEQSIFHPTGFLWTAFEYINGKAHGPLECWDIHRKYVVSAEYKNGKLQKEPPLPPPERAPPQLRTDVIYVHEVQKEFVKEVTKEFKISANGSGAGMPFDVECIDVGFDLYKRGTIEEARELMVKLKEKLADTVNRHEKIRPYLREYPFTPKRAEITLAFYQKNGQEPIDGSVAFVTVGKGNKIFYSRNIPNSQRREHMFEEPYDEAVKIVRGKKG